MAMSFRAGCLRAFLGACFALSWRVVGKYALPCFDLRRFSVNASLAGNQLNDVMFCSALLCHGLLYYASLCPALLCLELLRLALPCLALEGVALLCFAMPCFD